MCGIAGFIGEGVSENILEQMTDSLERRGPDGRGYATFQSTGSARLWSVPGSNQRVSPVGLGNRRLKILDLSENGAQPMSTPDGRFTLTFNGLIYNYRELADRLRGIQLRSTSDTEVLLHWLVQEGKAGIEKLNGIFAFALYDALERRLLLARDPVGVKPLYYTREKRGLFFGSEIRALIAAMNERPLIRKELVARYLVNGWMPDPDTLFEGIFKLPAGHLIEVDLSGRFNLERYWDLSYGQIQSRNIEELSEGLDAVLSLAITRQMKSDVPLAFFLSGGIDSSLLAAKAAVLNSTPPTAYTVGFEWSGAPVDRLDLEHSRTLAKQFGLNHKEIILAPSVHELLPEVLTILEEPIADTAALSSLLICRAARENFTVLISGQGGDELFGGYPVFRGGLAASRLQKLPPPLLALFDELSNQIPYSVFGRRLHTVTRLKKLFFSARSRWPEPFLRMRSPIRLDGVKKALTPELFRAQSGVFTPQLTLFEEAKSWDRLHQMLYLDFKTFLPSLNLTYTDKTSMWNSIDVRVPLLDLEVIRFMETVPSSLKFNAVDSKILLKAVCRGLIPNAIIDRPKAGFGMPLKEWLSGALLPMARDLLSASRLESQGLFSSDPIQAWLSDHAAGRADHSQRIFALMTFQLWLDSSHARGL